MQQDLDLFLSIVNDLLEDEKRNPVVKPIEASRLFETIDFEPGELPALEEDFKETLREIVLTTPRTATDMFYNQLFGGRNSKAILGDLLAVVLNNSMYTYKVAGPMIGVEKSILDKIAGMIGYPGSQGGTVATGGSMTNYMAMLMARDKYAPEARYEGIPQGMVAYTSELSHYSIPKNSAFIGLGRNNLRMVKADAAGKMDVLDLEKRIKEDIAAGKKPFFVNATAGTTVLGAFDPIPEIAAICKKYDIWLHVDGAYCGSVIFSRKYKHLLKGVEHTDSFSVNAHKMLGTPLTCSIIIAKDKKHLYDSFSNEASYLYQTHHDEFNFGKTSFQCGRRNDALKFWTLWKAVGTVGLEKLVDRQFELAEFCRDYIKKHPDYTLYSFDDSISICFNYKDIPARDICTALYEEGEIMVGYGSHKGTEFIRLVTINPSNPDETLLRFFKKLEDFSGVLEG